MALLVGRPERFPRYGFENAPLSKYLLLTSGAVTANYLLVPGEYFPAFTHPWLDATKGVWSLLKNQFVYESTVELVYGSILMYHLRILERQWGTKKFVSFILATCTLTISSHLLVNFCQQYYSVLQAPDTLAGGLYGPIFALLVFFAKDVYSGHLMHQNGFSVSSKWFTYFIALRMMLVNKRSYVTSLLGLISGAVYGSNLLFIQKWLCLPDCVARLSHTIYNWFQITEDNKPKHQKTFYGATNEIHEDMVFDYLSKLQNSRRGFSMGSRTQVGQGFRDTLQPAGSSIHEMLGDYSNLRNRYSDNNLWQHIEASRDANLQNSIDSAQLESQQENENEKIQRLVEMGFTRDAAVDALADSDHNVERATNILLSQ